MRELSIVELELVVGGYNESYDYSGSYTYNDSSVTSDANGNFSGVVADSDYQAMSAQATAGGWDYGIDGRYNSDGSWYVGGHVSRKS